MHALKSSSRWRTGLGIIAVRYRWPGAATHSPAWQGDFSIRSATSALPAAPAKSGPAAMGQIINEGDLVSTGADGSAQVRLDDNGMMAIRANSRVRIDEFSYQGKQDGSERGFSRCRKAVSAPSPAPSAASTNRITRSGLPATIGIRGTDHDRFRPGRRTSIRQRRARHLRQSQHRRGLYPDTAGMLGIRPNQIGFCRW